MKDTDVADDMNTRADELELDAEDVVAIREMAEALDS